MSEQTPVEEIIGWVPTGDIGDFGQGEWRLPDGSLRVLPANVDDLADWLHREVGWSGDWEHDHRGHAFVMTYDKEGQQTGAWFAPTILAALEAAVRAVHEQETSE